MADLLSFLKSVRDKPDLLERIIEPLSDSNHSISVALIGLGERIGQYIFDEVKNIGGVSKIYLSNRDINQSIGIFNSYLKPDRSSRLEIVAFNELHELAGKQPEVVVISADANPRDVPPKRELRLNNNLSLIKSIGEDFTGYDGNVIMVTNPVEPLSYVFASASGMDPKKVKGFSFLDALRLKVVISDIIGPSEVYVIGAHDKDFFIPVYRKPTDSPGSKLTFYDLARFTDANRKAIEKVVADYAYKQLSYLGGTGLETGYGVATVLKAMLYDGIVCESIYIDPSNIGLEGRLPIHFGMPVEYKEGRAIPRHDLVPWDDGILMEKVGSAYNFLENMVWRVIREGGIRQIDKPAFELKNDKKHINHIRKNPLEFRVIASSGNQIFSWDPDKPNMPEQVYDAPGDIGVAILRQINGSFKFLIGSENGNVIIYDPADKSAKTYPSGGENVIRGIEVFGDGRYIVGTSRNNGLYVWDLKSGKSQKALSNRELQVISGFYGIAKGTYNGREAAFVLGKEIYIFDPARPDTLLMTFTAENVGKHYNSNTLVIDGEELYAANGNNLMKWSLSDPITPTYYHESIFDVSTFALLRALGKRDILLASEEADFIRQFSESGSQSMVYKKMPGDKTGIASMALYNGIIAAGDVHFKGGMDKPRINIWRLDREEPYVVLNGAERSIRSLIVVGK